MAHVTMKAFKAAVLAKTARAVIASSAAAAGDGPATLRKALFAKGEDAGDRVIKFTISTNAIDLDNDTVNQDGWDLSVFLTNPLVLWMHDAFSLPVGKCVWIGVEDGALKAKVEFLPAETPERGDFAEAVYQMCRMGFLSATSVGFIPIAFEIAADRTEDNSWWPAVNFTKQKLLEFSIVTIPANSEALIEPAQQAAVDVDPAPAADPAPTDPETAAADLAAVAAKAALEATFRRAQRMARIL